jgi:hypothetical protein
VLSCDKHPSIAEVWQGSFLIKWLPILTTPTEIVVRHPANLESLVALTEQHKLQFDARLTRVLLPWCPQTRLHVIEGQFSPPFPNQTPPKRFLAYGSSITQGASAVGPSGMYAHRTAQLLGVDFYNLGFAGGAHLEPAMADYIAERDDWDFATLETGINMGHLGCEEFERRIEYFLEKITDAHPDKWIFCLGIFFATPTSEEIRFLPITARSWRRKCGNSIYHALSISMVANSSLLRLVCWRISSIPLLQAWKKLRSISRPRSAES